VDEIESSFGRKQICASKTDNCSLGKCFSTQRKAKSVSALFCCPGVQLH